MEKLEKINKIITKNSDNSYTLNKKDSASIVNMLEHLGKLPPDFDGEFLIGLLEHKSADVRFWAVKTIGKLNNEEYLGLLFNTAKNDTDTGVRREAMSSIGRMRSKTAIEFLIASLNDHDPKVALQAIRGLLVFKGEIKVDTHLKELITHPNETINAVINKEYFAKKKSEQSGLSHPETYDYLKNVVVNGDTIEIMKLIKDDSVHLTFTSPPYYNARDYSIYRSYKHYLQFLSDVFKQVHRITKEGRFFGLNTSPIIIPRVSRAHSSKRYSIPFDIHPILMEMGWEFIDDIIWQKPEASVKNRVAGFMQHRKPLGYKPNPVTEYIMVYRKKTDKLLDWNMKQYDKRTIEESKIIEDFETSNIWKIDPKFNRSHSAVFPEELCKRVIQYYSFIGDLVFDPFGGSGTMASVAAKFDRRFFLTELDKTYFEHIKSKRELDMFNIEFIPKFLSYNDFKKTIK